MPKNWTGVRVNANEGKTPWLPVFFSDSVKLSLPRYRNIQTSSDSCCCLQLAEKCPLDSCGQVTLPNPLKTWYKPWMSHCLLRTIENKQIKSPSLKFGLQRNRFLRLGPLKSRTFFKEFEHMKICWWQFITPKDTVSKEINLKKWSCCVYLCLPSAESKYL